MCVCVCVCVHLCTVNLCICSWGGGCECVCTPYSKFVGGGKLSKEEVISCFNVAFFMQTLKIIITDVYAVVPVSSEMVAWVDLQDHQNQHNENSVYYYSCN